MDALGLAERSWPLLRRLTGLHVRAYQLTGGRIGHRIPGAAPMLLLEHVGARSGAQRTTPLLYVEDGPNVVIIASKGGHPRHPAWYHNLRAHPDTTVQIGSERRPVHARVAEDPAERERLWARAVEAYGGYRDYQARTARAIPLVVLEPRRSP
jgi:deazaflavin-dependent oxidoreductase (nitroreductase family)